MANNRFTNLRRAKPVIATAPPASEVGKPKPPVRKDPPAKHQVEPDKSSAPESETISFSQTVKPGQVRRGRPRAKRSDTEFAQATAYIKKDTYTAVRHLLLDQRKEYSVLVQELLEKWLKEQR